MLTSLRSLPFSGRKTPLALLLAVALASCSGGDDGPAPTLQGVSVSPSTTTLASLGATASLTARASDSEGQVVSDAAFSWSSSDPAVATASGGTVTAVGNGTATVTVTATSESGTATGTATVVVAQEAAALSVASAADSVKAGESLSLSVSAQDAGGSAMDASQLSWSSSDNSVATVADGVVTALSPGQVTVTASGGAQTASVDLTVFLLPLAIGSDTTISGPLTVGDLTVATGATVTVQGMAEITAFGRLEIAGTVAGDCTPISIYGKGDTTQVSGTIRNTCSSPTAETNAPIELYGDGTLVVTDATIKGHGDVSIGTSLTTARAFADSFEGFQRRPRPIGSTAPSAPGRGLQPRATRPPFAGVFPTRSRFASSQRVAAVSQGINRDCTVTGSSIESEDGEPGLTGKEGGQGGWAGDVLVICDHILTLKNSTLRSGDGGDGGDGIDGSLVAAAKGGEGGKAGNIGVAAQPLSGPPFRTVVIEGTVNFSVGKSGSGGNATATGRFAEAIGGPTGWDGLLGFGSSRDGVILGNLEIELRGGGNGGNASAVAYRGEDATDATPAAKGGDATAIGGTDSSVQDDAERAISSSQLYNLRNYETNVTWTLREMGRGGTATAEAGNGGNGNSIFPDGGDGGNVMARGGGSPRHEYQLGDEFTPHPGPAGDAIVKGGNGGLGWNGCSVNPFFPGGDGGNGGSGSALGGPGRGGQPYGLAYMSEFGNGGYGGPGNGPGTGGPAGVLQADQPTAIKDPNLNAGEDGPQCASEISLPFGISIVVKSDPAGHEPFVAMTSVTGVTVVLDLLTGEMRVVGGNASSVSGPAGVAGDEKWIDVNGSLNSDDSFNLTGSGTAAGFPNTGVRLTGSVTRDGSGTITGFTAEYVVGTTGNLPTGQPVSYNTTAGN